MSTKKVASCRFIAGLLLLAFGQSGIADPRERDHVHVGGGLSHRPHTFTMQVWYQDIVYDESASNTKETSLDVYTPEPMEEGAPVMVFVHGGGYRVGDKASSKDLDPKPEYFTSKLGYIFVSINYRLLPAGKHPRNAQDVANAIAWVAGNIEEFGGDPGKIFLMGHSAGAGLVAQVGTNPEFLRSAGQSLRLLKGVIANEGGYGVQTEDLNVQRQEAMYGPDWRDEVAVANVARGNGIPPFLIFHVTGDDSPVAGSAAQARGFGKALTDAGVRAEVVGLDHVEHFGANEQIGEPGDITTVSVERFLDSITGRPAPAEWTSARPMGGGKDKQ